MPFFIYTDRWSDYIQPRRVTRSMKLYQPLAITIDRTKVEEGRRQNTWYEGERGEREAQQSNKIKTTSFETPEQDTAGFAKTWLHARWK